MIDDGGYIRKLRKPMMSLRTLSRIVEVSAVFLSDMEKGRRNIPTPGGTRSPKRWRKTASPSSRASSGRRSGRRKKGSRPARTWNRAGLRW